MSNRAIDLLIESANRMCAGEYTVDDENRPALETVAEWLRAEAMDPGPRKGLLLIGNVGSGKTMLMRAASDVLSRVRGHGFAVKNCGELVRMFNAGGFDGELSRWMNAKELCLDDLGTEGDGMHFGVRSNVMVELLEHRYQLQQRGLVNRTHFTSNLGVPAIKERYGERFMSRLAHVANAIGLGASKGAQDRRRSAMPMGVEPVDADNVYTSIHPDVATRLNASIAPVVERIKAERPKPASAPSQSHESALASFSASCRKLPAEKLRAMRDAYLKNYPPGTIGHSSALDYVVAIDEALKAPAA